MKKMLILLLALLPLLASAAQAPPTPSPSSVLCPTCYATLAVSSSSSRVVLPSTSPPYSAITVYNSGATDAFLTQGSVTVVATSANVKLKAGTYMTMWVSGTYLAAITSSSTTTLDIYQASGPLQFGLIPSGSATPSGPAGGNLGGTYPNPSIASLPAISGALLTGMNATNLSLGTVAAARGGAGTITGALKGNGAGVVSAAACGDLSDDGTACVASTGASGHVLPFLDTANTFSAAQSFDAVTGTTVRANTGFSANGTVGISVTCTVIPTQMVITMGLITSVTGGTCL